MLGRNLILLTDSYKVSHVRQYPPGTTEVYSYFESRGGEFPETVFYGLQYFLEEYLSKPITQDNINEADEFFTAHFFGNGELFNRQGWQYILDVYGGYLPVSIKAVPEGTVVPVKNVMMTVVNTDPKCFWLTNYLETLLSQVWYPTTVATNSREQKKMIKQYLERTADNCDGIPFKLHDFGFRGSSSLESSALGGSAHLINFQGTDTMSAMILARQYYDAQMPGFSIPASEHSTITSWGQENEVEAMRNMLETYPSGPVACVSDSYDIYRACSQYWGGVLKDKVLARDGFLVIRPDSGEACEVLPKIFQILEEKFGCTMNSKGYKILPQQVRVIQGDGISRHTLPGVLESVAKAGYSTDNLALGSGGGLLQKVNRDTCKFAFKCCSITVNSEQRDVYKQPVDCPWKISKKGKLKLIKKGKEFQTVSPMVEGDDVMIEVFRNGKILTRQTFDEIRIRAEV